MAINNKQTGSISPQAPVTTKPVVEDRPLVLKKVYVSICEEVPGCDPKNLQQNRTHIKNKNSHIELKLMSPKPALDKNNEYPSDSPPITFASGSKMRNGKEMMTMKYQVCSKPKIPSPVKIDDSNPERPFGCLVCNKRFKMKGDYTKHAIIHTGVKPYACRECGQRFNNAANCNKHELIHSQEKHIVCDVCGKSYKRTEHLKIHMRKHTGERPYKCDMCDKAYARLDMLKIHARVHSGEKPYACELCDRRYNNPADLRKHRMSAHTGRRPHKCDVCGKGFVELHRFKEHKKTHLGRYESIRH